MGPAGSRECFGCSRGRVEARRKGGRPRGCLPTRILETVRNERPRAARERAIDPDSLLRNREQFLQTIDGLSYGQDPREGVFRGSTFYHPELAMQISFPEG